MSGTHHHPPSFLFQRRRHLEPLIRSQEYIASIYIHGLLTPLPIMRGQHSSPSVGASSDIQSKRARYEMDDDGKWASCPCHHRPQW
jgi:hypothetical protein